MLKALKDAQVEVAQSGITAAFFNFFQGRATAFAIIFTVAGLILAFRGKLDANYALFVTAIQGLIFAHSCKEDWHEQRMTALAQNGHNGTTVVNNVTIDPNAPATASAAPDAPPAAAPAAPPPPPSGS